MGIEFLGATRPGAGGQPLPFSPAVRAGPFVFVSGQVAMGDNGEIVAGGIEAQTRQALANVERALKLAGARSQMSSRLPSGSMTRVISGASIVSMRSSSPVISRRVRPRRPS